MKRLIKMICKLIGKLRLHCFMITCYMIIKQWSLNKLHLGSKLFFPKVQTMKWCESWTSERSQLLNTVISFLASRTCQQLLNSTLEHVLSLLVSAIIGTGTDNNLKMQCATFLLEAGSILLGLPSSSSVGQVFTPTLVIHPTKLLAMKQHVAWGWGIQASTGAENVHVFNFFFKTFLTYT